MNLANEDRQSSNKKDDILRNSRPFRTCYFTKRHFLGRYIVNYSMLHKLILSNLEEGPTFMVEPTSHSAKKRLAWLPSSSNVHPCSRPPQPTRKAPVRNIWPRTNSSLRRAAHRDPSWTIAYLSACTTEAHPLQLIFGPLLYPPGPTTRGQGPSAATPWPPRRSLARASSSTIRSTPSTSTRRIRTTWLSVVEAVLGDPALETRLFVASPGPLIRELVH